MTENAGWFHLPASHTTPVGHNPAPEQPFRTTAPGSFGAGPRRTTTIFVISGIIFLAIAGVLVRKTCSGEEVKCTIPYSAAEALRWLRHLGDGDREGGRIMADSVFADVTDETITDEKTLRAALAVQARIYNHTPDAAAERYADVPAVKYPGRDEEKW